MEFSFEDHAYNRALNKFGLFDGGLKVKLTKILIPFMVCWVPLAIITLINGSFWDGDITTSFISNFDTQARFLISMPIFILAERLISGRLGLILNHFKNAGIVKKEDHNTFDQIVERKVRFLKSHWTDVAVFAICFLQVFVVLLYKSEYTSFLSWQVFYEDGEPVLNLAGIWSTLISRPFLLFLFYRWILRIVVWGIILRKISNLNLQLFTIHPDLAGGLGFLGYGIRYFSPVAFAISATVAGEMADFMLVEDVHLEALKIPGFGYLIFITLLFTLPLLSFMSNLIEAREKSVFEDFDYANGIYRELRKKFAKGFEKVNADDLSSTDYSAAADLSLSVEYGLKMKSMPFNWRDVIPVWVMAAAPFLGVVLLEIPVSELFQKLISFLV